MGGTPGWYLTGKNNPMVPLASSTMVPESNFAIRYRAAYYQHAENRSLDCQWNSARLNEADEESNRRKAWPLRCNTSNRISNDQHGPYLESIQTRESVNWVAMPERPCGVGGSELYEGLASRVTWQKFVRDSG